MMTPGPDVTALERRCPKLGGDVHFGYCLQCGEGLAACHKVFDCWWERFDVVAYLRANLSEEAFERLSTAQPKPKMTSLIDLIQQARSRQKD